MAEARSGPTHAGPWRVLAASLAGSSHQQRGLPCQDAHGWRELPGGLLAAAVADGAGSATRSDEGAALAVLSALEALVVAAEQGALAAPADGSGGASWDLALRLAFAAAQEALVGFAAEEGIPLRDLACTLALALGDEERLTAAQIGDGAVLVQGSDGSWQNLLPMQKGEYANEVLLLSAPDCLAALAPRRALRPKALVMSTDGLLRLMLRYPGGQPHGPFLEPLLTFCAQAEDPAGARRGLLTFLGSERVCARTDDDKTLLIALALPAEEGGPSASAADARGADLGPDGAP